MELLQDTARENGRYIDVDGLRTYYEVTGSGEPVVLLHGGMCTAETFDGTTPALAQQYQVFVPERRGHGRTPDLEGPITYENMAEDTIAFMEKIGIGPAHLVGWSDGGNVGLLVALHRPDLVRKLVAIGSAAHVDGYTPEMKDLANNITVESAPPMFAELYAALSPDGPGHFGVVFEKLFSMYRTEPSMTTSDLEAISAPTLVMLGEEDCLTIEHAATMFRSLPDSQLAVVPGTSHALPMEKPELTNRLILDFLATEQVPKIFGAEQLRELSGVAN